MPHRKRITFKELLTHIQLVEEIEFDLFLNEIDVFAKRFNHREEQEGEPEGIT